MASVFVTFNPNSVFATFARWPPDAATALSMTSIACAPYAEYGFGVAPICLPNDFTNAAPAPLSLFGGSPATLMYAPSATVPFDFGSLNPSGISSWMLGSTDLMSFISFWPLLQMIPPTKTAVAPLDLIELPSAS